MWNPVTGMGPSVHVYDYFFNGDRTTGIGSILKIKLWTSMSKLFSNAWSKKLNL